jgi:hypothetical protein
MMNEAQLERFVREFHVDPQRMLDVGCPDELLGLRNV